MTIEIQTIVEGWQEDEQRSHERLKAIRDLTSGCPCDRCPGQEACGITGHQCDSFKRWCKSGSTKEVE